MASSGSVEMPIGEQGTSSQASPRSHGNIQTTHDHVTPSGGYDHEFLEPTEDYECPVCCLVSREPIQTECGHSFCETCWNRHATSTPAIDNVILCPVDMCEVNITGIFINRKMRRKIRDLEVYCDNRGHGCPEIRELRDIQEHLESCQYWMVSCDNFCGETVVLWGMDTHKLQDCGRRDITCPTCSVLLFATDLEAHESYCQLRNVKCEFCHGDFLRSELDAHHKTVCPQFPTYCSFATMGCTRKVKRCDLKIHNETRLHHHMDLLRAALVDKSSEGTIATDTVDVAGMSDNLENNIDDNSPEREQAYELPVSLWHKVPIAGTRATIPWSELPGWVYGYIPTRKQTVRRTRREKILGSISGQMDNFPWKYVASLLVVLFCCFFCYRQFHPQDSIDGAKRENVKNVQLIEKLTKDNTKMIDEARIENVKNAQLIKKLAKDNTKMIDKARIENVKNVQLIEKLVKDNTKMMEDILDMRKQVEIKCRGDKIDAKLAQTQTNEMAIVGNIESTESNKPVENASDNEALADKTNQAESMKNGGQTEPKTLESKNNNTLLQRLIGNTLFRVICLNIIWLVGFILMLVGDFEEEPAGNWKRWLLLFIWALGPLCLSTGWQIDMLAKWLMAFNVVTFYGCWLFTMISVSYLLHRVACVSDINPWFIGFLCLTYGMSTSWLVTVDNKLLVGVWVGSSLLVRFIMYTNNLKDAWIYAAFFICFTCIAVVLFVLYDLKAKMAVVICVYSTWYAVFQLIFKNPGDIVFFWFFTSSCVSVIWLIASFNGWLPDWLDCSTM